MAIYVFAFFKASFTLFLDNMENHVCPNQPLRNYIIIINNTAKYRLFYTNKK